MNIEYKHIKNGYARIDKDGQLLITIPLYKKNDQRFIDELTKKAEQLLQRYNKRTHITPIKKESVLLFGEEVPIEEVYMNYKIKKTEKNRTKILKQILEEYALPIVKTYSEKIGIMPQKLSVRKTTSKRGSCTHDQKISLNLDLVHLPTKYIKYVTIHECCHLKEKNHSKRFRALVKTFCPEYAQTKKELNKFVIGK